MLIYLPCRLGESFIKLKFKEWVAGKRVYVEDRETTLNGFSAFDFKTRSLSIPIIYTPNGFCQYDHSGEFGQEFKPKYKIMIDLWEKKLCDAGFPGKRTVKVQGLHYENGMFFVELVTTDKYEHLRFPIKDNIKYALLNEEVETTNIEYCKIKEEEGQLSLFDL